MTYANPGDLASHLRRTLDVDEQVWAGSALADAATVLDVQYPLPDEPTSQQLDARRIVSCRMVARVLAVPSESTGAGSVQQSGGPYQLTRTFSSGPAGEMYLTKADRALLHGRRSGQRAFEIDPLAGRDES